MAATNWLLWGTAIVGGMLGLRALAKSRAPQEWQPGSTYGYQNRHHGAVGTVQIEIIRGNVPGLWTWAATWEGGGLQGAEVFGTTHEAVDDAETKVSHELGPWRAG